MIEPDAAASAEEPAEGVPVEDPDPWERPIDKFRRGAAGSVLAAGMLGLRDALEGRSMREDPPAVADAPEPKLDDIELLLDPDHPENSRAIVYLPAPDDADD